MAIYSIEAITNLHVGDMGTSFDIVDNTVQRDAATGYPSIYATSLKGAVRSVAEQELDNCIVNSIFGKEGQDTTKGNASFNDALLLLYPVRSSNHPYYLATCPAMLRDAQRLCDLSGNEGTAKLIKALLTKAVNKLYTSENIQNTWIEEWVIDRANVDNDINNFLDAVIPGANSLVILSDENMGELTESLPVVARNVLKNSISANLWYEEFVPRKSVFITAIFSANDSANNLDKVLLGENGNSGKTIQIGANATVGYGVCHFRKL